MPETLYLTGFGPFPGVEINPTEALARQLDGLQFGSLRVQSDVLPVAFDRAASQTRAALTAISPEYIVHLGVATTAETLRLETRAVNCADTNLHDIDADADAPRKPGTRSLISDLPREHFCETRVPLGPLLETLNGAGFPTQISDDAGRYVCNSTYFHSLKAHSKVLFVHVPPVHGSTANRTQEGTAWTAQRLNDAVQCLLQAIADLPSR